MGRKFDVALPGRSLRVCVAAIDEAWELWICDATHRLALAGRVAIDDALAGYRAGRDPIALAGQSIAHQLETGRLMLPTTGPVERCPPH